MINVPRYPNALDHALAAIGCILAVYAAGLSIGRPSIGILMASLVTGTSLVGALLGRWFRGKRLAQFDGLLMFAGAIGALAGAGVLNRMLPEGGYPLQLIFAGVFSWMLVFGSLAAWRDPTLCFLVVPTIAIFGLVGAFDTVKEAPFFFFVFLVSAATLFFRSHARAMMDQAEASMGADPDARAPSRRDVAREAMQTGAWKWMAGPEWALGSALVIVLLSVLGAPVIQQSVQGVAGQVRLTVPIPPSARPPAFIRASPGEQSIGGGPASFLGLPILRVKGPSITYLRGRIFDTYTGSGWTSSVGFSGPFVPENQDAIGQRVVFPAPATGVQGTPVSYSVVVTNGSHNNAYVPGIPQTLQGPGLQSRLSPEGAVETFPTLMGGMSYSGTSLMPARIPSSQSAVLPPGPLRQLPYTSGRQIADRVRNLAIEATSGATSDAERAQRIKSKIEEIAAYNLKAPAVPSGKDPVDYFLFESKQGYCDLFASAMVTMSRSVGLPARIVTGYLVQGTAADAQGFVTVKDENAHMWAELYFDGLGWVPYDPTEGAVSVDSQGRRADRSNFFGLLVDRATALLPWAFAALALGFGVAGLWRGGKPTAPSARSEVGIQYARLQRTIERHTGHPRRLGQTPREFVARSAVDLGELAPTAMTLTERFETLLYGPTEPNAAAIKALRREVDEFRQAERRVS